MNKDLFLAMFGNEDKKQEKEKFKLGQCSFENNGGLNPIKFIKQNKFFGYIELKNLSLLFSKVPVFIFDNKNKVRCKDDVVFKDIYFMVCVYDIYNWCCHQAAPFFSIKNPDWDCLIGFAFQRMGPNKVHTFLHSFNAKGELFVDPTIQARHDQQAKWVQNKTWDKTQFQPDDFYQYMGIKFPTDLANKIVFGEKDVDGNIWGYLLKNVLNSRAKTIQFIDVLNNKTEWVI